MPQDQNYVVGPTEPQLVELVIWKCGECGYEVMAPRDWVQFDARDRFGDVIAMSRACAACLISKLNDLIPQMKLMEG